jgi:hypothetical protein
MSQLKVDKKQLTKDRQSLSRSVQQGRIKVLPLQGKDLFGFCVSTKMGISVTGEQPFGVNIGKQLLTNKPSRDDTLFR